MKHLLPALLCVACTSVVINTDGDVTSIQMTAYAKDIPAVLEAAEGLASTLSPVPSTDDAAGLLGALGGASAPEPYAEGDRVIWAGNPDTVYRVTSVEPFGESWIVWLIEYADDEPFEVFVESVEPAP